MFKAGAIHTRQGLSLSAAALRRPSALFLLIYAKQSKLHSRKAFTLPEILLATAILAIALSGLLSLFCNILLLNQSSQNQAAAMTHAEYVMEDIKNTTFTSITTSITAGTWDWNKAAVTAAGLTALTGESIDAYVSGSDPLNVTVAVAWTDNKQRTRTLTLETKIASP